MRGAEQGAGGRDAAILQNVCGAADGFVKGTEQLTI